MKTLDFDRLWSLLPALHRVRDAERGELRDLVSLFAEQFAALEENAEQLYDDLFIETCADWVAPYIGELIGYRTLHGVVPAVASPRADVANTIAYRRRKGTAHDARAAGARCHRLAGACGRVLRAAGDHAVHEPPARACPGDTRPARHRGAAGARRRLQHARPHRRDAPPRAGQGRFNIPNIGIFLWRIEALPLTRVPLVADPGDASGRRWRINPLGADLALFRRPVTEASIDVLAEALNMPEPLRVRPLALQMRAAQRAGDATLAFDWGDNASLVLFHGTGEPFPIQMPPAAPGDIGEPLVRICDLRDDPAAPGSWAHEADLGDDEIGIDPERGRVLLGDNRASEHAAMPFSASLQLGQMRRIGGGEYERIADGETLAVQRNVAAGADWQPGLDDIAAGGRLRIDDSLTYRFTPTFRVDGETADGVPGHVVVVSARNGARPLLAAGGDITLEIGARGTLVLEGLVISGATLQLAAAADNEPRTLILRDCTRAARAQLAARWRGGDTRRRQPADRAPLRPRAHRALDRRCAALAPRCADRTQRLGDRCHRPAAAGLRRPGRRRTRRRVEPERLHGDRTAACAGC